MSHLTTPTTHAAPETGGRHLANLYPKLGVSSRAAATAAALRLGLA